MKLIITIGLVIITLLLNAQNTPTNSVIDTLSSPKKDKHITMPIDENSKIAFSGVSAVVNKTKQQLYSSAKEYIVLNYTAKDFPTILDEQNERIYVKGTFKTHLKKSPLTHAIKYDLIYTYKIFFKDNKYRYEITDFILTQKTNSRISGYYWGGGFTGGSIKEGQVITTALEKMYAVKRYCTKKRKLFYIIDLEINKEITRLNDFMKKEIKVKEW